MSNGEMAYLILVIGAFGVFGLILAWETWKTGHK